MKIMNPILKLVFLFITIYIPLKSQSLNTTEICEERVSEDTIFLFFDTNKSNQDKKKYFSELKKCLKSSLELQDKLDTSIIMLLRNKFNYIEEHKKSSFIKYLANLLLKNAKLGNSSSMHNYATFHNENPNSPNYNFFPSSQKKFSYWTHKAASLREPRAIFNLAIRIGSDIDSLYFEKDLEKSFRLFYYIKTYYSDHPRFSIYLSIIDEKIDELQKKLGEEKIKHLIYTNNDFDFKTLAPIKAIIK